MGLRVTLSVALLKLRSLPVILSHWAAPRPGQCKARRGRPPPRGHPGPPLQTVLRETVGRTAVAGCVAAAFHAPPPFLGFPASPWGPRLSPLLPTLIPFIYPILEEVRDGN